MNKLDYLAPPPSAYKLIHEDIDIKWDKGDGKFLRRIFNRVPYAEYEIQQILEFRKLYPEMVDQNDSLILRFIQAGSFQSKDPLSRAHEMLSKYLSWKQTEVLMTPNIQKLLQDGAVYQFGRDIRHRPIIYFDIPKLKKHLQEPYLIDAIVYLLKEIEQVMLLEYHVEQWVIVLNIDFMGIISLPIGILRKIIEQTSTNFCCLMYRMFIVNPSYTLKTAWRVLSSKYNAQRAHINNGTSDKIQFINDNDFTDMLKIIPNTQLEQKFGGTVPNIQNYWFLCLLINFFYYLIKNRPPRVVQEPDQESIYYSFRSEKNQYECGSISLMIEEGLKEKKLTQAACCSQTCNIF